MLQIAARFYWLRRGPFPRFLWCHANHMEPDMTTTLWCIAIAIAAVAIYLYARAGSASGRRGYAPTTILGADNDPYEEKR
jgi:hypothetical protein